jgi:N-acetylmuramoyl-L-alanine amidase
VGERASIAEDYGCDIMLSIHCNAANGAANGTETFYRGEFNKELASKINAALCAALGTKSRGVKTESASQHSRLAVMSFQPCFLIELGFIDNAGDFEKMLDPVRRLAACEAIAELL